MDSAARVSAAESTGESAGESVTEGTVLPEAGAFYGQCLDDALGGAEEFLGIGRFAGGCFQALLELQVEGSAALRVPRRAHGEERVPADRNADAAGLGSDDKVLGHREYCFTVGEAFCEEVLDLVFAVEPGFCNCLLCLGIHGKV